MNKELSLAIALYNMASDMDSSDYEETREAEITNLADELGVLKLKGNTLYNLLETIANVA